MPLTKLLRTRTIVTGLLNRAEPRQSVSNMILISSRARLVPRQVCAPLPNVMCSFG